MKIKNSNAIKPIDRLKNLSRYFTALVVILGILVLLGWYFDIDVLKHPLPTLVSMNPLTATCFILCAFSLFLLRLPDGKNWEKQIGYIFAWIVLAAVLLRLFGTVFGIKIQIDKLLFHSKLDNDKIIPLNSRMARNTALGFVFTSIALLLIRKQTRKNRMPSHYLTIPISMIGMLSVLGYLYQVKAFYGFMENISMAIHTAVCFLLMALAILFAYPEKGIMAEFTRTQVGAITARRLIPAAILIPIILGLIALYLEWHGFVSVELGVAILVLGNIIIFLVLIWFNICVLNKKDDISEKRKKSLEQKNKEILDSITYAKRLQDAILPPLNIIKKYLPDSFLLYKPKDIVAGDFYWMDRAGDTILIAAADCTGHGVPGAMISVICSNALNRTVKEFHITEPGKILDKVRELVLETFEKSESDVKDGMDISLCCIHTLTKEIQWSGAYNPLWYIQNNELKEVEPDKQPIGRHDNPKPFNTHSLKLQKGDTLYLFTDGYADQFGGPKGKKFKYKQLQEKLLAMKSMSMNKQKDMLNETIESWMGDLEQVDDVLIMGIRI